MMPRHTVVFEFRGENHNSFDTRMIRVKLIDYPFQPVIGGTVIIPDTERPSTMSGTITEIAYPAWKLPPNHLLEMTCAVLMKQYAFDRLYEFLSVHRKTSTRTHQWKEWSTHGNAPKNRKTA